MTLEEAIAHSEEVATTRCGECANEHEQLAEWLRELRHLKAENAKLRELLVWAVEVADDYYYCSGVKDDIDAVKNEMKKLGIEVDDGDCV